MFERMANGWEMARESLGVLKQDVKLLVFPLVSGAACLLVLASFALPLWNSPYLQVVWNDRRLPQDPIAYAILFAFYFVNYFVIIFFNSALVACAVIRFKGGEPTLSDGLGAAATRLPQILGWAAVSATVGVILRLIESRSEKFGQIVSGLLGMAWSICTYFVVPVLVVENVGPIKAVGRSTRIVRKTWGEALTANFGIGAIAFLFALPAIAALILGFMAVGAGGAAVGFGLIALGIAIMLVVSLVSSALDTIVLAALYLYAAEGQVPRQFNEALLKDAFSRR